MADPSSAASAESLHDRALLPMKEKLARLVLRINPKWTIDQVSMRLLSAGLGRRVTPTGFLAAKGMFLIGGVVFGIIVGGVVGGGMSAFMFILAIAGAGFIGPDFYINTRIKSRREKIRAQLPDALDLLAVSVEAGLGFDGALQKLTEQMEGPLIEEFTLTLGEMRIGETRQDALKKFSERVDAPEVSAFVRSIIQADQFGISLGRILKVQAADTRLRRQQAAEEKAMKAPIKMLFPTVAFIFPAMFLVILGPAFLNLTKII
jgi:tight adherence protein C